MDERTRAAATAPPLAKLLSEVTEADLRYLEQVIGGRVTSPRRGELSLIATAAHVIETLRAEVRTLRSGVRGDNEQASFDAGVECHLHGPDNENCAWPHFSSPRRAAAWQRGKAQAEQAEAASTREHQIREMELRDGI